MRIHIRPLFIRKMVRFTEAFLIKFTLFVRFRRGETPLGNTNELPVSGMSVHGMANERGEGVGRKGSFDP